MQIIIKYKNEINNTEEITMANIIRSKKLEPIENVKYNIKSEMANIGIVAYKTDGNDTQSFLIISDANNQVVDVQKIEKGLNNITLQQPTLILDSTSNARGHIESGYYEQKMVRGEMSTVVSTVSNNGHDASQNIFHDPDFGRNRGVELSCYERQRVYDRALSMLDFPEDMKPHEIASYLNRATEMYSMYQKDLPEHSRATSVQTPPTQMEVKETADREWNTIIQNTGVNGFESRVRLIANDINNEQYQKFLNDYDTMQSRAYVNQLERAEAERKYDIVRMSAVYTEHSQTILQNHSELLAQDGLTSQVGSHSETSLRAIRSAIEQQQHQIDLFVHNNESPNVINKRLDYLKELTVLEQHHPAMLANVQSSGNYHFMADQNIHASINDNIGGHSRTASESFEHAFVLYNGDMSQREYHDYLVDKSKIIHALAFNDGKKINDYYDVYRKATDLTEEQRLDLVRKELQDRLSLNDSSHINDFLHSHEFATIMRDRTTLYSTAQTNNGTVYISWNENSTNYSSQTTSPEQDPQYKHLAPAYSVLLTATDNTNAPKYDLSTREGCLKYQKAIDLAMEREEKLGARPSQELLTQKRFIEEYINYNELSQTANRVRSITNNMNSEKAEYSDATLAMLNDVQHRRVEKSIDYLKQHGFDIDFKTMPTTHQMYQNYDSLANGFDKILTHSTADLNATLKNCKGLEAGDQSLESRANSLCDKINDINTADSPYDRAKKIAESMGYTVTSTISNADVAKINESYNRAYTTLSEINQPGLDLREPAKLLSQRVAVDLQHEVQVTRGCDNLYTRDPKTSAFTNISESELASAKRLDFATAIAHSELPARDAAKEVVSNHELRNELIHKIETNIAADQAQTLKNIREIKDVINDPKAEQRTEQIAQALGINLGTGERREKIIDIMRSNDFEEEFRQMLRVAETERINATASPYFVRLEPTMGLNNYRTIINNQDIDVNYSMLGNKGYIEHLSSQASVDHPVHIAADKLIEKNHYMEMLVVTRNLEDIVHRTNASEEEIKRAKQLAEDYAFINAVEARDVDTKIRIVQYQEMINAAADKNHLSSYAQHKVEDTYMTIGIEARALEKILDRQFADDPLKTSTRVSTSEQTVGRHEQVVIDAIKNDDDFYRLRGKIEDAIHANPHYKEMVEHNEISHKQARLNEIDKQIDDITMYRNIREAIKNQHEHEFLSHIKVKSDIACLQEWDRQLDHLRQEREFLVKSMQSTMEHVEHRRATFETFKNEQTVSNATAAIKDALQTYGSDTLNRMAVTRHVKLPDYTAKEFLEASSKVEVPACNAETLQKARLVLAEDTIKQTLEQMDEIRLKRIAEIQKELAPKATHTEITPDIVNKLIIPTAEAELKSAKTEAEEATIKSRISHYRDLSRELAVLQSADLGKDKIGKGELTPEEASKYDFSFQKCAKTLAQHDRSVTSLSSTYDLARDTQIDAGSKLASYQELQDLRSAYRHMEEIRIARETLSVNELSQAADYNFKNQHAITTDDVKKALSQSDKFNEEEKAKIDKLVNALQEVSQREPQVIELMEKINKGNHTKLTEDEFKTLAAIRAYNEASAECSGLKGRIVQEVLDFKNGEIKEYNDQLKKDKSTEPQVQYIQENATNKKLIEDLTLRPISSNDEANRNLQTAINLHHDKLDVVNSESKFVWRYELTEPSQRAAYVAQFCDLLHKNTRADGNVVIETPYLSADDKTKIAFAAMAMSQYSKEQLQSFYADFKKDQNAVIMFPKNEDAYQRALALVAEKDLPTLPATFESKDSQAIFAHCQAKVKTFENEHPYDSELEDKKSAVSKAEREREVEPTNEAGN